MYVNESNCEIANIQRISKIFLVRLRVSLCVTKSRFVRLGEKHMYLPNVCVCDQVFMQMSSVMGMHVCVCIHTQ